MCVNVLQVAVQSLWNIRLAVFVRPEHENRISQVNSASVKTGLGNALGIAHVHMQTYVQPDTK